ncbi:hypothetical protein LCGC14_2263400, partial [marine sediment metagenome]
NSSMLGSRALYIGGNSVSNGMKLMDEVAVFDTGLSTTDIDTLYGLRDSVVGVPEPATMSLLVLGAVGVLLRRRRTR